MRNYRCMKSTLYIIAKEICFLCLCFFVFVQVENSIRFFSILHRLWHPLHGIGSELRQVILSTRNNKCKCSRDFLRSVHNHLTLEIQVPYIRTFKLRTFKDANMCSHVQSHKLVHVSGVHCHTHASSISGCAFVYFTVQYYIEYSSTVSLFQAQDVQKQW